MARSGETLKRFDRETLDLLDARREVRIHTSRPDGRTRRTIIWVMVEDDDVFIRSVRGDRGYWYQAALDDPDSVALRVGDRLIDARPILATDEDSIERCSAGVRRKYRSGASVVAMLRPETLGTTLRLEPR
jgi:hypothetical protein